MDTRGGSNGYYVSEVRCKKERQDEVWCLMFESRNRTRMRIIRKRVAIISQHMRT